MATKKLKPCRYCNAQAFVMYGGDTGEEDAETTISCNCKMSPMVAALFHNDAVKMWNAAMLVEATLPIATRKALAKADK